jgi:hypothetical protein
MNFIKTVKKMVLKIKIIKNNATNAEISLLLNFFNRKERTVKILLTKELFASVSLFNKLIIGTNRPKLIISNTAPIKERIIM